MQLCCHNKLLILIVSVRNTCNRQATIWRGMSRSAVWLPRWRIRAVISRRVRGASSPHAQITTNRSLIAHPRIPPFPPWCSRRVRSRHNADVLLDRRYPIRVRAVLCSLFYNPLPYCPLNTDRENIWEGDAIFVQWHCVGYTCNTLALLLRN